MKVAAHPMLVAVALGLLGPQALAEDEPNPCKSPKVDCREAPGDASLEDEIAAALEEDDAPYWTRLELRDESVDFDPDEQARIEAEWEQARRLVV